MEGKSALKAWMDAQRIALAPIIFQATRLLRDSGILAAIRDSRAGLSVEQIANKVDTSSYGVLVLLEAGLAADIVRCEDGRYLLTATGLCVLTDESTRINMDVVQECCYQPAFYLEESIQRGEPIGLKKVFGDWETIYPALPDFPESAAQKLARVGSLLFRRRLSPCPAPGVRAKTTQAPGYRRQHGQVGHSVRAALCGCFGDHPGSAKGRGVGPDQYP